jgi:hypothetical protein
MTAETQSNTVTLGIDVDTSSLERALVLLDRITDSANAARAAFAALASTDVQCAPLAVDLVAGELQHDETPVLILAELKALRADLAEQREAEGALGRMVFAG